MKETRALTEGAILASIFIILLLISMYIPLVGIITIWTLPLPFVVFVFRRGLKAGGILGIVACILTFFVGGIQSLPAAFIFGSAGIVIGELYRRKQSGFTVLIGAGLVYTLDMVLFYLGLIVLVGIDPMKTAMDLMKEQMTLAESTMTSFGQVPGQTLDQMLEMIDRLVYLAPVMLVGVSIVLALISVVLSSFLLRRLGHKVSGVPPFREWKFSKAFIWYYLIVLLLAMIGAEEGTIMFVIIWNLFPLLEMILTIQGFAFVFYYFYHKKVATALPVLLVITALVVTPLLHVVRILGIIDLGFDLRKRITSQKK